MIDGVVHVEHLDAPDRLFQRPEPKCGEMLADLQQFLMGQDVVFTAKSLSGWLKDAGFAESEHLAPTLMPELT